MPLTFEDTRAAGATIGSGVVMVYDDRADLRRRARPDRRLLPRRIVRAVRPLPDRHRAPGGAAGASPRRPAAAARRRDEIALLRELGQAMRDASICGLGQTASAAVESAIRAGLFPAALARPLLHGGADMSIDRIFFEPPARASRPAEPPAVDGAAVGRAHDRRRGGHGAGWRHDPRRPAAVRRSTSRRSAGRRT